MGSECDRTRRRLLGGSVAVLGLTAWRTAISAPAVSPVLTPAQGRGPFYPSVLPLDHDNDLTQVAGREGVASGEVADIVGRVLDAAGGPVRGARIEIWQCDANGRYHHPRDRRAGVPDPNFQGYGQTRSEADGGYRFRTIRPVPYPGRAPHIHFVVRGEGVESLVTQMYVEGAPENDFDFLLNSVDDPAARQALIVPLRPPAAGQGLRGWFDIVVGGDGRLAWQG